MRSTVMTRQRRDLQKVDSPSSFRNRLVAPVIVGTFDVGVSGDPQIDRAAAMLLVELVQKVFEDVRITDELKVFRILVLDQVIEIRRPVGTTAGTVIRRIPFAVTRCGSRVPQCMMMHRDNDFVLGLQHLLLPPVERVARDRAGRYPTSPGHRPSQE
jgi:hypothetical protein